LQIEFETFSYIFSNSQKSTSVHQKRAITLNAIPAITNAKTKIFNIFSGLRKNAEKLSANYLRNY
jgi:hypothetical protein